MFRQIWKQSVTTFLMGAVAIGGNFPEAIAAPAPVFVPYLEAIRANLPVGWAMRLPSRILLSEPADPELSDELVVKVMGSKTPPGLTIGLYTCHTAALPCLVGSLSVDSKGSLNTQRELQRHQAAATPIRLGSTVRGYLLEGSQKTPSTPFSSVMWEQDGMIYTVSFLSVERQNILFMAYSMANEPPYLSLGTGR